MTVHERCYTANHIHKKAQHYYPNVEYLIDVHLLQVSFCQGIHVSGSRGHACISIVPPVLAGALHTPLSAAIITQLYNPGQHHKAAASSRATRATQHACAGSRPYFSPRPYSGTPLLSDALPASQLRW
jgi:hypothetical protein